MVTYILHSLHFQWAMLMMQNAQVSTAFMRTALPVTRSNAQLRATAESMLDIGPSSCLAARVLPPELCTSMLARSKEGVRRRLLS